MPAKPVKHLDEEQIYKLALIGCTHQEIATWFGVSVDTLARRYQTIIKEGHESMKQSLKRKQIEVALGGNVVMLIWLGKQLLGQKEPTQQVQQVPDSPDGLEFKQLTNESKD